MEQQLILDRYRPLELLGEGGYGTVVSAWDTRMQRRVAIKRLPLPRDSRGTPHVPHGLAEARTAAMLAHPGIVTVFDFDTDSDEAFIVMEYVDGLTLGAILDELDGPLTLDEAASVIEQVTEALIFAHENGVLHLDLKPDNVLIDRSGTAKVTDFGMAELSSLSGHGPAWGGTPGYMPLEQLEGASVDERTDEWALAALAYECLAGDNPFIEATHQAAVVNLEVLDPPPPSHFAPELREDIDDILMTALAKRPQGRYESVIEFSEELLPSLGDSGVGQELLAELVETYAGEVEPDGEPIDRLGLWDRLHGRTGSAFVRAIAVAQSAVLAWIGLQPWGLQPLATAGAAALIALAAAMAPSLGIGIAMLAFALGFGAAGSWGVAAGLSVATVLWWWFAARHSSGTAIVPVSAPVLGLLGLGPAAALLGGFALRPARAASGALAGGVLLMLASAASTRGVPYLLVTPEYALNLWDMQLAASNIRGLLTDPVALIALAGWPVAAALMSLACHRAARLFAAVGALTGAAALAGAYIAADQAAIFMGADVSWVDASVTFSIGASLILVFLVIALGAPMRPEEDTD